MSATENDTTTEKATHTPGPWTVGDPTLVQHDYPKRYVSETVSIHAPGRVCVATAYAGHEGGSVGRPYVSVPEGRANWQLIAAAPELLNALRMADDYFHDSRMRAEEYDGMRDFVARAIAKAEGR